jgi:hypothetical protein
MARRPSAALSTIDPQVLSFSLRVQLPPQLVPGPPVRLLVLAGSRGKQPGRAVRQHYAFPRFLPRTRGGRTVDSDADVLGLSTE